MTAPASIGHCRRHPRGVRSGHRPRPASPTTSWSRRPRRPGRPVHDRWLHGVHQRGAVAGNFAYVDRGTCALAAKADNAENAGATGIVVGNNPTAVSQIGGAAIHPGHHDQQHQGHRDQGRCGARDGDRHDGATDTSRRRTRSAGWSARRRRRSAARSVTCGSPPATATRARSATSSTLRHRRQGWRALQLGRPEPRLRADDRRRDVQRRRRSTGIGLTKAAHICGRRRPTT